MLNQLWNNNRTTNSLYSTVNHYRRGEISRLRVKSELADKTAGIAAQ